MGKKTTAVKGGVETVSHNRSILITDVEEMSVENFLMIKSAHWNMSKTSYIGSLMLHSEGTA